jgi:hypothetical protein
MSVPGRIGIILIIALAIIDAVILASGARDAASALETHALVEPATTQTASSPIRPQASHERLLSVAIREISLWTFKRQEKPAGI